MLIKPFRANTPFLHLLKMSENLWITDFFSKYRNENWHEMGWSFNDILHKNYYFLQFSF